MPATAETKKLNLRLPPDLFAQLAELAQAQDRSVNSLIVQALRKEVTWLQSPRVKAMRIPADQAPRPAPAARLDNKWPKVGRNDPCPCGSGKKAKFCHQAA